MEHRFRFAVLTAFSISQSALAMPLGFLSDLRDALTTQQALSQTPALRSLMQDPRHQMVAVQRTEGQNLRTTRFQHSFEGIEILGGETLVHERTEQNNALETEPATIPNGLNTQPSLNSRQIVAMARSLHAGQTLLAAPALKILPSDSGDSSRLLYEVKLRGTVEHGGYDIWVDAHTGEILAEIPHHQTLAAVQVYRANSKCQTLDGEGMPTQLDIAQCQQTVKNGLEAAADTDTSSRNALENSRRTLTYYEKIHGRKGFDNLGADSVSVVQVGDGMNNAFWDSQSNMMAYGAGDGVKYNDFTIAPEVAGHEMTHGVISRTAKLLYTSESGALNEAFADYFGVQIHDDNEWAVGRKLFITKALSKGLRDLAEPGKIRFTMQDPTTGNVIRRGYPAHINEMLPAASRCNYSNDYCWVHINSTIPGHAFYRIHKAIGKEKAEKLLYLALTQYLTSRTTFRGAREGILKACAQLHDQGTCAQVQEAFAQVGL